MESQNDGYTQPSQPPTSAMPPSRPSGRSPWVTTGVTGVVAVALAVGLVTMSGSGSSGMPSAGKPPVMPTLPGLSPDDPRGPAGGPTGRPTSPRTPTAKPTKNDWNTATGDKTVFTAAEWFPQTGTQRIESSSYDHLAKDDSSCTQIEPGMRLLMTGSCVKVIRSVWTNAAKTHVGALSVVSLTDKSAADNLQRQLTDDKSNNDYVRFIRPPASSGVTVNEQAPSWISMTASGHYVVIAEVARADGKPVDATSRDMVDDLRSVVMSHINTVSTSGR
jgi:hypothetical protein